jgi:hypothetical protein
MISDLKSLALTIMLWSGLITLLAGVFLAVAITDERARQHEKTEEEDTWGELGSGSGVNVFLIALPFIAAPVLIAAIAFGVGLTGYVVVVALSIIRTGNPFISILFVAGAILLYGMRTRYPFVYGFIEAVVGISAIVYVVLANQQPASNAALFAELLSVSGGMYVIVRGLDNMTKALPKFFFGLWVILRWGVPLEKK